MEKRIQPVSLDWLELQKYEQEILAQPLTVRSRAATEDDLVIKVRPCVAYWQSYRRKKYGFPDRSTIRHRNADLENRWITSAR